MKLISMTDFVLEQSEKIKKEKYGIESYYNTMQVSINYANFLKQPLNLGMFVPCDEDGNVLEKPSAESYIILETCEYSKEWIDYKKAKEKVLFEGFELVRFIEKENPCYVVSNGENEVTFHIGLYNFSKGVRFANTVEDLIPIQPILTKSVIKQIGL